MTVNSYLTTRASQAVLSTTEKTSITTSIATLKSRLDSQFDKIEQLRFGSSTRDTILPRAMDEHSDIDYMVIFSDAGYNPQTYLDRLKKFAQLYYSSSDIFQSSPTIVLQLNHIKFELVPALKEYSWYKIPNGPSAWQTTDPNDFNKKLSDKNVAELSMIKPAIRLLKYWNAVNSYVFDSYSLEKYVVDISFYGINNMRDYLFKMIENLYLPSDQSQYRKDRLERAKTIISKVRELEKDGYPLTAEGEVKKLIPE